MMVKGGRYFTIVKNGKATVDVSELFRDGDGVEVVVLEDSDKITDTNKDENSSLIQMVLEVSDEAYPHIKYILEHMEGVDIVEDTYIENNDKYESINKVSNDTI